MFETRLARPYTVYAGVLEGGTGTPQQVTNLGTSRPLAAQTVNFTGLKKNTRYTAVIYGGTTNTYSNPLGRFCFKTRGEFTNAEQNLKPDGTVDLTKFSRTGCFAVARTLQDINDCMCNGTRGGTRILAGVTQRSQEIRGRRGCPNLTN